jgi:cytochrome c oxidase subunit 4
MSEHIVSKKIYFLIFGALLLGTGLTVMMAFVDLDERFFGGANAVTALTIAVIKATLVVLYFMHVRYSSRLTWLIVSTGILWLAIMFIFTFSDYATRPVTYTTPAGAVVEHTKAEP